ncbi:hypothetical protein [Marinilabilia rubra]|uniref:Nif11 domain-containing protein n=1 Tax=Marinilabilia rubra TaxID=2162893 RepID=A0A2U2BBX4_9BACT|nr:hypothetical protein [Marinilabilia rubra]PWE00574.1 hypothetical protein DDZ16_02960 [Marinilabilia rubra]
MALGKAIRFIRQASFDKEFRKACYNVETKEELLQILDFNDAEFEDAFNMELVKCQTSEQADMIYQLKSWYHMI